jgi:hypothetical protein
MPCFLDLLLQIVSEPFGLAVNLLTSILEVIGSNLSQDTDYPEADNFYDFLQALQEIARKILLLCHDHFLSNFFQFIMRL